MPLYTQLWYHTEQDICRKDSKCYSGRGYVKLLE